MGAVTYRSHCKMVTYRIVDRDKFSWQSPVRDKDLVAPPASPVKGDRYIVAATASGDWLGHENDIAEYNGSLWQFYAPSKGWIVYIEDEDKKYFWNGSVWGLAAVGIHTLLSHWRDNAVFTEKEGIVLAVIANIANFDEVIHGI